MDSESLWLIWGRYGVVILGNRVYYHRVVQAQALRITSIEYFQNIGEHYIENI